jgi:hypothetical protein
MKKSLPLIATLLMVYLTGFLHKAGEETFRLLESCMKAIPGAAAHWVAASLQQSSVAQSIFHISFQVGLPVIVILFSFKILKEWIYVDRMYVLRDLLEAKKIKPSDLTEEQHYFIYIHWPDLFKP